MKCDNEHLKLDSKTLIEALNVQKRHLVQLYSLPGCSTVYLF